MTQLTIAKNSVFAVGGPFVVLAGAGAIVNFEFLGTGTLTGATNKLYRGKADVTATKLASPNAVISGRTVTSALATLDIPGDYQLEITVTDGTLPRVKAVRFFVAKNGVY